MCSCRVPEGVYKIRALTLQTLRCCSPRCCVMGPKRGSPPRLQPEPVSLSPLAEGPQLCDGPRNRQDTPQGLALCAATSLIQPCRVPCRPRCHAAVQLAPVIYMGPMLSPTFLPRIYGHLPRFADCTEARPFVGSPTPRRMRFHTGSLSPYPHMQHPRNRLSRARLSQNACCAWSIPHHIAYAFHAQIIHTAFSASTSRQHHACSTHIVEFLTCSTHL